MKNGTIPFLFEIGTEEIPARFFGSAVDNIKELAANLFEKNRIEHAEIRCLATPRRIALLTEFTDSVQKTAVSEVVGPPVKAAFDASGKPTKAAEGFARAQSMAVSELVVKKTDRGDYVAAVKEIKGEKVSKVLPVLIPELIRSIHFPKAMRWGHHSIKFVRPIRWLLCLLGESVVRFEIDGIKSGSYTYGHRLLSPGKIRITKPSEYEKALKKVHVIADQAARKDAILSQLEAVSVEAGGSYIKDEALLDLVTFLVEYPTAVLCSFPAEYLDLPPELLITVMKDHQKYFALVDKKDRIVNSFIVISNTSGRNEKAVREGAEKVIRARFEDARFYYSEDIRTSLESRLEMLKRITYQEKLGTIYDKVERIKSISGMLAERLNLPGKDLILQSATLCKSDLTTGVVREFPELQGIMGFYYAAHEDLPAEVALAIKEHYKPLNASDSIPGSDEGRIVSTSDKIDSIISFFSVGMIPSGSEDPYALRRQAQGIVQILLSIPWRLPVRSLIGIAAEVLNRKEAVPQVESFFLQRIDFALSSAGFPEDVIKALIGEAADTPLFVLPQQAAALVNFRRSEDYSHFLTAIKRVKNILPADAKGNVDSSLFTSEAETLLYERITPLAESLGKMTEAGEFAPALELISSTAPVINNFFEKVMVMDKDENVRKNRISLLKRTWDTAGLICDFSQLSEV